MMPYVCGIIFACFAFFYLYFYQADYLAQFQYHFSHGETSYNSFVGAVLIILPLLVLGLFCHGMFRWPLRFCALSWFPSAFLLTFITCLRFPELPDYSVGTPWISLISLFVLFIIVACLCLMHPDATSERSTFSSYLSSNFLVLIILFFMTGALGYDSGPGHRELRVGLFLQRGAYDEAVTLSSPEQGGSYRLYALRTAALALDGQLGERLFEYPIPEASQTLLPQQSDTLFVFSALPILYKQMRAVPLFTKSFSERKFLQNALALDSVPRPLVLDYLLCSYLLCGELQSFSEVLLQHTDSLTSSLPKHYREALILQSHLALSSAKPVTVSPSSSSSSPYEDSEMHASLLRFDRLHQAAQQGDMQALDSLLDYTHTYWMYYVSRFQ